MKKLILLAFVIITNIFAGSRETSQEGFCGDKSLSYCINHFDRQCEAKNYLACGIVGDLHCEQKQYGKAKKYFEMLCDKANSKDGFQVEMIDGGMGPEVPIITTMKLSCGILGTFYSDGTGVRQSYEKAFHYCKKACNLGDGDGCAAVGFAYYYGRFGYYYGKDVKKDLNTAIKFFAKSCELEYDLGCAMLGIFYESGEGVKQNYSKAKELFGKACDLGYQKGCDYYKELKEKGY